MNRINPYSKNSLYDELQFIVSPDKIYTYKNNNTICLLKPRNQKESQMGDLKYPLKAAVRAALIIGLAAGIVIGAGIVAAIKYF